MTTDGLLDRLLTYSLFHRDVLSSEEDLRALQGDYFGVFVTIRRAHRLGTWPDDIHGCIGHWHPSYEALSPEELLSHALDVGYRAMWEDSRRHRFDHFVDRDPDTWLELDLMRRPLYPVHTDTGLISIGHNRTVPFTNDTYGLIVQHSDGARATYLPHVFDPSMPWVELRNHLVSKAGLASADEGTVFYAYEITQYKRQLHQVLDANRVGAAVTRNYVRRLMDEKNDHRRYPFLYQVNRNGRRRFEEHEDVRNLSTLMGLLHYDDAYGGGLLRTEEREWLLQRCRSVLSSQIQTLSPQALSFAGYVVQKYVPEQQATFCQRLLQALPKAEPQFERGELLLGLRTAGCSVQKDHDLTLHEGDSIFQMNWTIQAMVAWGKSIHPSQRALLLSATDHLLQEETNSVAVAWEALCAVYSVSREKAIKDRMFALFFHLERRRTADGFYAFLSGDSRIDITDHVVRGYLHLHRMPVSQEGGKGHRTRKRTRTNRRRFKQRTQKQNKPHPVSKKW